LTNAPPSTDALPDPASTAAVEPKEPSPGYISGCSGARPPPMWRDRPIVPSAALAVGPARDCFVTNVVESRGAPLRVHNVLGSIKTHGLFGHASSLRGVGTWRKSRASPPGGAGCGVIGPGPVRAHRRRDILGAGHGRLGPHQPSASTPIQRNHLVHPHTCRRPNCPAGPAVGVSRMHSLSRWKRQARPIRVNLVPHDPQSRHGRVRSALIARRRATRVKGRRVF